jgi:predicted permease
MFFQWLLPLVTSKDWIIFVLTIPISGLSMISQGLAAIFATQILPEDKQRFACKLLFWFILPSMILSLALTRFSFGNSADLINMIQTIIAIFITYSAFSKNNS